MAKGDPLTSPYVYDTGGDSQDNHLIATFSFDNTTRVLSGLLVHRDPGCVYIALLLGDPNSNPVRIPTTGEAPDGDTNVSAAELNAAGFTTVEDVLAMQITATE